eukprot:Seg19525.1 transcript_id=Seg19525.1/GoldUCD/mRNA.D3Y31 product="hypothetical protein" protein_id=Seg19525.1/GoldUCD/D3Y31
MRGIVQRESISVFSGRTTVEFGAAEHISYQDLISRTLAPKTTRVSYNFQNDPKSEKEKDGVAGGFFQPENAVQQLSNAIPAAQSHFFGAETIVRGNDGAATIYMIPTSFHEMSHDTVKTHALKINNVDLTDDPLAKITLTVGEHKVYVHFTTDDKGKVTGTPEALTTTGAIPDSTHHVPAVGEDDGTDGDYYKHCGTYIVTAEIAAPVMYRAIASPEWMCPYGTGGGGGSGTTGETIFQPNGQEYQQVTQSYTGGIWGGTAATIAYQTFLKGVDHIHVNNDKNKIQLANANKLNMKPAKGNVGWYEHYTIVAGEIQPKAYYCTSDDPPNDVIPQSTDPDIPTQGGTTNPTPPQP